MKISEVLRKIANGEELTDEEKAFAETYEEPDLDAVANAKGKKERLKLEKQIAELQEQLAEKAEEIETVSSSASEAEKLQKQIEKMNAKIEQANQALEAERQAHSQTQRSNALKSVNIPWLPNVPDTYRDTVLGKAFDGIDTEDLHDPNVVKPIIDSIIESQSTFIQASTASGAGTGKGEAPSASKSDEITLDNVTQLRGEKLLNNLDKAFAVANQAKE